MVGNIEMGLGCSRFVYYSRYIAYYLQLLNIVQTMLPLSQHAVGALATVVVVRRVDDGGELGLGSDLSHDNSGLYPFPSHVLELPVWQSCQKSPALSPFGVDENDGRRWHFAFASRPGPSTPLAYQQIPE